MNTHTPKICTTCGAEHLGIYSHIECTSCYFKNSAYWERQTIKERILTVAIYLTSGVLVGLIVTGLYGLFF